MGYQNIPDKQTVSISGSLVSLGYTLDAIGSAAAAYSFRKLSSAYSGSAVRVRRSSDNNESDIGFDEYGNFDSSAFNSFVGGGDAFCVTFYDQSGNGKHLTQATAGSQPKIVQNNSQYVLLCQSRFLRNSSFVGGLGGNFTASVVWRAPATTPSGFVSFQPGLDWSAGQNFFSPWHTTIQQASFYSDSVPTQSQGSYEDGKWRQHILKYSSGQVSAYEFGTQMMAPISRVEPNWSRLTLGQNDFGGGDLYIAEFILWSGNKSQTAIFENFKNQNPSLLQLPSDEMFIVLGDSITTTEFCGLGKSWSKVCFDDLGASYWYSICNGGWRLQDIYDNRSIYHWYPANLSNSRATAIIFAGTNDRVLDGVSASEALTRAKNIATEGRLNNINRVLIATPVPRFENGSGPNISFESWRQDFSDLLINDTSGAFDAVLDVRDLPIGVNGAQDSLTYFVVDKIHLNAAGEQVLGLAMSDLIQNLGV